MNDIKKTLTDKVIEELLNLAEIETEEIEEDKDSHIANHEIIEGDKDD